MIKIQPKNVDLPDLDSYLSNKILDNLKQEADFTTLDKMR